LDRASVSVDTGEKTAMQRAHSTGRISQGSFGPFRATRLSGKYRASTARTASAPSMI
jgi:hypothetical protein